MPTDRPGIFVIFLGPHILHCDPWVTVGPELCGREVGSFGKVIFVTSVFFFTTVVKGGPQKPVISRIIALL